MILGFPGCQTILNFCLKSGVHFSNGSRRDEQMDYIELGTSVQTKNFGNTAKALIAKSYSATSATNGSTKPNNLSEPSIGESNKKSSNNSKQISIQVHKPVLLSGPVIRFMPALSRFCGGEIHAIVFQQLRYLSRSITVGEGHKVAKRISLTRLQRQIPFVSRRWLIKVLAVLEDKKFIEIHRTNRVNVYVPASDLEGLGIDPDMELDEAEIRCLIIIPTLAEIIGLKKAIVLQQIHIRIYQGDGSIFFIHSLEEWHSENFPFWSISSVKRIFSELQKLGLIFVKKRIRADDGFVHAYRVNYMAVATLLGLPIPEIENPFIEHPKDPWDHAWNDWTNPVTLVMQKDIK